MAARRLCDREMNRVKNRESIDYRASNEYRRRRSSIRSSHLHPNIKATNDGDENSKLPVHLRRPDEIMTDASSRKKDEEIAIARTKKDEVKDASVDVSSNLTSPTMSSSPTQCRLHPLSDVGEDQKGPESPVPVVAAVEATVSENVRQSDEPMSTSSETIAQHQRQSMVRCGLVFAEDILRPTESDAGDPRAKPIGEETDEATRRACKFARVECDDGRGNVDVVKHAALYDELGSSSTRKMRKRSSSSSRSDGNSDYYYGSDPETSKDSKNFTKRRRKKTKLRGEGKNAFAPNTIMHAMFTPYGMVGERIDDVIGGKGSTDEGDVTRDPVGLEMSRFVHRDLMQTMSGIYSSWTPKSSRPPTIDIRLSPVVVEVKQYVAMGIVDRMRTNTIFNAANDKLLQSVCPNGMDVTFVNGNDTRKPLDWFLDKVINGVWLPEVKMMMRMMQMIGHCVVTLGPNPSLGGELAPHVLQPGEYKLEYRVDQNGVRYYTPRPYGYLTGVNGVDVNGHPIFDAAVVFVHTEPGTHGELNSNVIQVLEKLLHAEQINRTHRLILHEKANPPLITHTREIVDRRNLGANGAMPVQTCGGIPGRYGQGPSSEELQLQTLRRTVGMNVFAENAGRAGANRTQQILTQDAVDNAVATSRSHEMQTLDETSGMVASWTPEQSWQRSCMQLPINTELTNYQTQEMPRETIEMYRTLVSEISVRLGIPPQELLGALGGGAKISAAELAKESLTASVESWRDTLCRVCANIYWRIYGVQYVRHIAEEAAARGHTLTMAEGADALRNMTVKFSFRKHVLTYDRAKAMFDDGVLNGSALTRVAMKEDGLSHDEMLVPMSISDREKLVMLENQIQLSQQRRRQEEEGEDDDAVGSSSSSADYDAVDGSEPNAERKKDVKARAADSSKKKRDAEKDGDDKTENKSEADDVVPPARIDSVGKRNKMLPSATAAKKRRRPADMGT